MFFCVLSVRRKTDDFSVRRLLLATSSLKEVDLCSTCGKSTIFSKPVKVFKLVTSPHETVNVATVLRRITELTDIHAIPYIKVLCVPGRKSNGYQRKLLDISSCFHLD